MNVKEFESKLNLANQEGEFPEIVQDGIDLAQSVLGFLLKYTSKIKVFRALAIGLAVLELIETIDEKLSK